MKMEEYQTFGIDYHFDGGLWMFTIEAKNWEEAKERLKAIAETGRVYGSNVEVVDVAGANE